MKILSSSSLKTTLAGTLAAFALGQAAEAQQTLTNVKQVNLEAATASFSKKVLTLRNARFASDTTTLDDYTVAEFKFEKGAFTFVPKLAVFTPNVGVFCQQTDFEYFAANVTPQPTMTDTAGNTYAAGQVYNLATTGQPLSLDLATGQIISVYVANQSDEYTATFRNPDGAVVLDKNGQPLTGLGAANSPITDILPAILRPGKFTLTFTPRHGGTLTLQFAFYNANHNQLTPLANGTVIAASLAEGLRDYVKYVVNLNQGDILSVTPSFVADNLEPQFTLVNQNSQLVSEIKASGIIYQAPAAGTYYLFLESRSLGGGDYRGTATITR